MWRLHVCNHSRVLHVATCRLYRSVLDEVSKENDDDTSAENQTLKNDVTTTTSDSAAVTPSTLDADIVVTPSEEDGGVVQTFNQSKESTDESSDATTAPTTVILTEQSDADAAADVTEQQTKTADTHTPEHREHASLPVNEGNFATLLRQALPTYRGDTRTLIEFFKGDTFCRSANRIDIQHMSRLMKTCRNSQINLHFNYKPGEIYMSNDSSFSENTEQIRIQVFAVDKEVM